MGDTVSRRRDDGTILVLTLILTVVLAVIVLAVADYVTVGLRTSEPATERTDSNHDAASTMNWAIEQFSKKQLTPGADCGNAPVYMPVTVPNGLVPNGSSATLACAQTTPITGEPVIHLIATVVGPAGSDRFIESTVEVPQYLHGTRVSDWRVDIPINVPPYTPTTTTSSTSTTTTSTTIPNAPPVANATIWALNPSATSTMYVNGTDSDGTIASTTIITSPLPAGIVSVTPTTGTELIVETDGSLVNTSLDYTVTDDDGATSAVGVVNITATTSPTTTTTSTTTTTTTTLAPNLTCAFEMTGVATNGKSGTGTLSIANLGGGDFTGWRVSISRNFQGGPWDFSWAGDITVSGTYVIDSGPSNAAVAAGQSSTGVATAQVTNGPNGKKLEVGDDFTCTRITP